MAQKLLEHEFKKGSAFMPGRLAYKLSDIVNHENLVSDEISRRLDDQRFKLLDAFRAPGAARSSPDEHDDAADENSCGGGYNHGELTILDEHGAQFGGDGLESGSVHRIEKTMGSPSPLIS
ncbi:hypothetical protein Bca4012_066000 [Brassica carinata]|uniref:Uncharacterized protein n=1 Tax=Brassica carinata TaxID=52824 RepID=A0A8X7VQ95_BRACI|nr:hypothetical protein Bca52824_018319 [Brassica carinata]